MLNQTAHSEALFIHTPHRYLLRQLCHVLLLHSCFPLQKPFKGCSLPWMHVRNREMWDAVFKIPEWAILHLTSQKCTETCYLWQNKELYNDGWKHLLFQNNKSLYWCWEIALLKPRSYESALVTWRIWHEKIIARLLQGEINWGIVRQHLSKCQDSIPPVGHESLGARRAAGLKNWTGSGTITATGTSCAPHISQFHYRNSRVIHFRTPGIKCAYVKWQVKWERWM